MWQCQNYAVGDRIVGIWPDMWVWQNHAVGGREIIPTYGQDSGYMASRGTHFLKVLKNFLQTPISLYIHEKQLHVKF
jgi:hypothetical protein